MAQITIGNNLNLIDMKHYSLYMKGLLASVLCLVFHACSNDDLLDNAQTSETEKNARCTMQMKFVGNVIGFDQQNSSDKVKKRATTTSNWTDGDKIYITFYDGSTIVPGEATYSSTSGWSVSYEGNLPSGTGLKCEARYFVNTVQATQYVVTLSENSEIYEDLNASFTYSGGSLTVQASLAPKTGRIRFTGTKDTQVYVKGITYYSSFTPTNNTFYTTETMIHPQVQSTGSTPYIYGYFTDEDRRIGLVGDDYAFTRLCTSDMLKTGESGYMAIPSEGAHNNWRSGLYVKASGVEFKMIPVAGYSGGFFLIGETEVTEALYNSVNGTPSTSQFPASKVSYSNIKTFIEKVNNTTKLNFSLPTGAQWEYAAKGGTKSQNYTYCGSNTPGDVAWYSANASSKQKVKTKAPNELGIYDMSGNVAEFTTTLQNSSYYASYRRYGGCYGSASSDITKTSFTYTNTDSESLLYDNSGFRLKLTCP